MQQSSEFRAQLYFLTGPTAVGKTALSLAAAHALKADILSCDSLCVYRGMDIGTAKPSLAERSEVRHHGIDLVEPSERYSVEAYADYARRVVADCDRRRRHLMVVGGSGFYLKSFFAPVADGIVVSTEVVRGVEKLLLEEGLEGLLRELAPFDPDRRAQLDRQNPRRVAKALERCLATGRPLLELQAAYAQLPEPYGDRRKQVCLLEREAGELRRRVRQRVDAMLAEGLIDEVKRLQGNGFERNSSAAGAIGYRETLDFLRAGERPEELSALRESIAVHTDQLIRKQRIWFRRQVPVDVRVDAGNATVDEVFPGAGGS